MTKHSIQKLAASLAAILLSGCMTVATQPQSNLEPSATPSALISAKAAETDYRHAK